MIINSSAMEYAKFSGYRILRIQTPPIAVSSTPQTKVLKAPRSYFSGLLALIPASTITQTPKKPMVKERNSPIVAIIPMAKATRQTATIITNMPNEKRPNGLLGIEILQPLLKLFAAFWTELGCCQNWMSTFRTVFCSGWCRNFGSAF